MTTLPVAMLGHVCATRRGHCSQGSGNAGDFPTTLACRAGPGRSPRDMSCTTGRLASPGRRPAAVRPVGSSAALACRSVGSENALSRCRDHAGFVQLQVEPPRREASRAENVQLKAVVAMSPKVWNGSARSMAQTVTPQLREGLYVSNDSTPRHAGAQQCMHARHLSAVANRLR
jgi:hypothetical protein